MMRCAVDDGRPVRRAMSLAVCMVRSLVNVSSARTMRSVIESPDREFAMGSASHAGGARACIHV